MICAHAIQQKKGRRERKKTTPKDKQSLDV
jgi:hypothetical protein